MSTEAPKPTRDELFVVLLGVFRLAPCGLLVICGDLKGEGSCYQTESSIVAQTESRVKRRGQTVDHVHREANQEDPCS